MFHIGASKSTLTNVDVVKCGGDGMPLLALQ